MLQNTIPFRAFGTGRCPRQCHAVRCNVRVQAVKQYASERGREPEAAELSRRQALASQLVLAATTLFPQRASADEAVAAVTEAVATEAAAVEPAPPPPPPANPLGQGQMKELSDPILAYKFQYPVVTTKGKQLSMLLSRQPEKYSSAAPLTADARQRIVSEVFDFKNFVGASMNVGPASGVLKGRAPSEWKPKEVALTVLIDRSTARTTAGQRVALNDVQSAKLVTKDGLEYWVYEHVSQGSPTIANRGKESYRHALAITSWRPAMDGTPYLYTLNLSCPEELWPELSALFQASVDSFSLLPTTRDYIPPDKDPWLFF